MRVRVTIAATILLTFISPNADAFYSPFDYTPLGQFRAGFYGSIGFSGLRGLDSYVQGLLSSYAQSGRQFGFYPQAFNSASYFGATNFDSSGVFFRIN